MVSRDTSPNVLIHLHLYFFLDFLNLSQFYQNLRETLLSVRRKDACLQTDVSLVNIDNFNPYPKLHMNLSKKKPSMSVDLKQKLQKNNDCFLLENEEIHEIYRREPSPEKTGLGLHKSFSDMSIVTRRETKKPQISKPRQCRECFRLQHRCPECGMRLLLKKHLTGKTNQREFTDFLVKCCSETSNDYRRIFSNALEKVGKELDLSDNLERRDVKSGSSITEQLAVLNKNRTLLGGMKKQNMGIVNRAGKTIRRRASCEELGKHQIKASRQVVSKSRVSNNKPLKQNSKEKFVIDKNDPVLKDLIVPKTKMVQLDDEEFCGIVKDSKKSIKALSQFHLSAASPGHSEKNLTVQNFIIDVTNEQRFSESILSNETLNEMRGGEFLKDDISVEANQTTNVDELLKSTKGKMEDFREREISCGIEELDRAERTISDLDSMLQEIGVKLEDSNESAKKKKSKTDVSCAII